MVIIYLVPLTAAYRPTGMGGGGGVGKIAMLLFDTPSPVIFIAVVLPTHEYGTITMTILHTHAHTHTHSLGELDPERVGSGIQYGNAQLRKPIENSPSDKSKCSC